MTDTELHGKITALLNKAGLCGLFDLAPLNGGANNRLYRVDVSGSSVCLKVYFKNPCDHRNRLGTEFAFCRFAWERGITTVPRPLFSDSANLMALYEFIPGTRLEPEEITEDKIEHAIAFYHDLNRYREEAVTLPPASDAAFSVADHMKKVDAGIERLCAVEGASLIAQEARRFVRGDLLEAWKKVQKLTRERAKQNGLSLEKDIPLTDRRISPSDFGFHNAIYSQQGELRFIDFEYAGWDDPAKMVCDFFLQPEVPVAMAYYELFRDSVAEDLARPEDHIKRIDILLPVFGIKWILIMLNDFVAVDSERRSFAYSGAEHEQRKEAQLQKARHALKILTQ